MPIEQEMPEMEESGEAVTASLPAEIIKGQTVSPGDVIRLEVVSVDDGGITVKYAEETDNMNPPPSTMKQAAAMFAPEEGEE